MHDGLIDDIFHPRFVFFSPVHRDELNGFGRLERSRFTAHVDAAIAGWQMNMANKGEQTVAVRDFAIELLDAVIGPTTMRIDVWVEHLDPTSCVFGFLCSSESGVTAFARGERTITRLDAPWSSGFLDKHATLTKHLPAYA